MLLMFKVKNYTSFKNESILDMQATAYVQHPEEHNHRFSTYGKYLAFDCDDPPNIQEVVRAAKYYMVEISGK